METFLKQCQEILEAQGFKVFAHKEIITAKLENDKEDELNIHISAKSTKHPYIHIEIHNGFYKCFLLELLFEKPTEIMPLLARCYYVRLAFPDLVANLEEPQKLL
jgi:hypothetical protein